MTCNPSPFPIACLQEADKIAPTRNRASDGICGDYAHQHEVSDHNPDGRGIPHAFDVTQDAARFDAHSYGDAIARLIMVGRGDPRIKYMVAWDGYHQRDKIISPYIGRNYWRMMTTRDHSPHLHVSFFSGTPTENSTTSFFGAAVGSVYVPPPPGQAHSDEDYFMLSQDKKSTVPGRTCTLRLNPQLGTVDCYNGAALMYDQPTTSRYVRRWKIGATAANSAPKLNGVPLGMAMAVDGKGVVVTMSDYGTFHGYFS